MGVAIRYARTMRRVLHLLTLILAGCGGNVVFEIEGAGGGATATDGSTTPTTNVATAASGMGGAPTASTTTGDVDDTGIVASGTTTGGEGCPPEKPTGGTCAPEGLVCDYGGFCNFVVCSNGGWSFPVC